MNVPAPVALVIAGAAAALGLGAVTIGLMPLPRGADDAAWAWASAVGPEGPASAAPSGNVDHDRAPLGVVSWDRESESVWAALPRDSATGQSASPLYPKIGVTLWDRIRVSSPKDRRAFLWGSTIQVHARAATRTPGRQSALPHGVD